MVLLFFLLALQQRALYQCIIRYIYIIRIVETCYSGVLQWLEYIISLSRLIVVRAL